MSSQPKKHPLDPLNAEEIKQVSSLLKVKSPGKSLHFKIITIFEPPKARLRPFLKAERNGTALPPLPRIASALYYHRGTADLFLAEVNVESNSVEKIEKLDPHLHGQNDIDEVTELRDACLADPKVKEQLKKFKIPDNLEVVCDTWPYGRDSEDNLPRYIQCYLFARSSHPGSNHYDNPLPISPVLDMTTKEVIDIIRLPAGSDATLNQDAVFEAHEPKEYHHDLHGLGQRTDLKPLIVHQPEGVSFTIDGYLIKWQKWRFRLGFTWREGMVLHDVTYDGRELFHRLSLSEMFVPYGDPRYPYSRKSVFDVGDIGAGVAANNLALGCDCLGVIKYFSFVISNSQGQPVQKPNAICMHEIDDGIGWKHTNSRTGAVSIVRSRVLVLQTIITVGNYEYVFMWHLDQAAGLHYRIQATGILSTAPIDKGATVPWGTNVNEGVMAPFHQHVFSLRIDPNIDGDKNSVIEEDSVAMPLDENNPFGVGYVTKNRVIAKSTPLDSAPNRVHKIINPSVLNKASGKPVAYAIHSPMKQMLLAHPNSWHGKRAKYAFHPFWVTAHRDNELYAAGDYTYQSLPDGKSDLGGWADREDKTDDTDIVVWHSISLTHNPRPEDYPVMPCDTMVVSLKPSGFFDQNPALDVPQSTQKSNGSKLIEDTALVVAFSEKEGDCCTPKSKL
ncbi:related to copper amine oxidase [Phialocephala subalpina]|uniref:Amine oxidase n=1 Tax=Phialocephala subalpina TaxID=576137 RepID=A0A1L7WWG2_9HELO|nr:related to copper amine oxidase [Phialocephala subalpina]